MVANMLKWPCSTSKTTKSGLGVAEVTSSTQLPFLSGWRVANSIRTVSTRNPTAMSVGSDLWRWQFDWSLATDSSCGFESLWQSECRAADSIWRRGRRSL